LATAACGEDDDGDTQPARAPTAEPAVPTLTPTWVPVATAKVITDDLNVRSGPGTSEAVIGRLQPGDEVPVSGRWQGGQWLALPGIGWTAYSAEWQELDVEYRSLPVVPDAAQNFSFTGPVHPPDVRVGIPVVDQLVDAVVGGDRRALAVIEQPAAPAATPTSGSDPSAPCVDGLLPASQLTEQLDALHTSAIVTGDAGKALRLYGVVRGPIRQDGSADYVVVFAFDRGEGRQFWVDPRGHITQFSLGCSPTLPGAMLRVTPGEAFFWFRPALPPPLHPVP
jgi:hypothetical protein